MRKSLFRWTVAMLTLSAAAVSGACSEEEYEDLTKFFFFNVKGIIVFYTEQEVVCQSV